MTFPCPKCGRLLQQTGEATLTVDGQERLCPVFQCDDCPMPFEFDGETFEGVYTFALDPDGRPFIPPTF